MVDQAQSVGAADPLIDMVGKDERWWFQWGHRILNDNRADRRRYDGSWDRWRRYYGGDQWSWKLRPPWKARPVMNYIFAAIETIIPIMTDRQPTINVVSKTGESGSAQKAEIMQNSVRAVFGRNEFPSVRGIYTLKNSHLYGTGITKQWYDPVRQQTVISSIDTRFFFPSRGAVDVQSAENIAVAFNRTKTAIYREYPKAKGKIRGGVWDESFTHQPVSTQKTYDQDATVTMTDQGALVGTMGAGGTNSMSDPDGRGEEDLATFVEIWNRDDTGQVWVTIMANGVLLRRTRSPYRSGKPTKNRRQGLYPFARCLCYPIDSQFWGMGEVAQLESPQDALNRVEAQIADYSRMVTAPYMLIHRGSRVSLKDITNRLASFIVYDGEQPPRWMEAPGVPAEFFTIGQNNKMHMDIISGVYDASRGQLPSSKTSGVAIENLQQATSGRVALKTRMFESYLVDVAQQVIELEKQFQQDSVIRVGREYHWINKFKRDKETKQVVLDPKTQEPIIENDVSNDDFDVEIGVGSTLPIDKGVRFDQATTLREMGAMSKKGLLRDSGRSEDDVERILKEQAEEDQEELAMAGAAEGGPPQEGAPVPPGAQPVPAEGGGAQAPTEDEVAALEQEVAGI